MNRSEIEGRPTRRQLLRWIGWFGVTNAVVLGLVAQRYLWTYQFPDDGLGIVYVALTFIGQMAFLAIVPTFLLALPFVVVFRSRRLVTTLGVIIAATSLSLLILDANVFTAHRFHLGMLTVGLFETATWIFTGILFVIFLAFEAMVAGHIWRKFALTSGPKRGRLLAAFIVFCWLGSQMIHMWGDAIGHTPVTQFTRVLPLYNPIYAKNDMERLGLVDPETARQQRLLKGSLGVADGLLNYPLSPMRCNAVAADLPNILIILIDGLRPDTIDPQLTPTLASFRAESVSFEKNFSGGNSSRMGIFSMFYGVPSTYWQAFYDSQRSPVLMDMVRARSYDVGLFSAVGFGGPALLDRTAFAGWPGMTDKRSDLTAVEQNMAVTTGWLQWLDQRSGENPFFGFMYYDPPMGEMQAVPGELLPMDDRHTATAEARRRWLRYRLANRRLDDEVRTILDSLRERELLDDTIVIIASDHGYEFNDNGLGHYGHASNFTATQLRSTLMMRWPGNAAATIDYRTMHHDLPVTLLQDVFGCDNPPSDYSVGRNLFAGKSWDWMISGSYTGHAIIEPDRIIVMHPGGFVEVLGSDYRPTDNNNLDPRRVQDALEAQSRFLK